MTACCVSRETIENAVLKVSEKVKRNNNILKKWDKLSENELFSILVGCILGSRVRYETTRGCVKRLKKERLLEISCLLKTPKLAERKIFIELKKPIYPPFKNGKGSRYIYAKSRARFVVQTIYEVYNNQATTIKTLLKKCTNEFEARDALINTCMGIGPKQASLFLRDIHYTENLAILDSHVIQYMGVLGLQREVKKAINKTQYINYEKKLISYANSLNKSLYILDVAIWIVMRVLQREFKWG